MPADASRALVERDQASDANSCRCRRHDPLAFLAFLCLCFHQSAFRRLWFAPKKRCPSVGVEARRALPAMAQQHGASRQRHKGHDFRPVPTGTRPEGSSRRPAWRNRRRRRPTRARLATLAAERRAATIADPDLTSRPTPFSAGDPMPVRNREPMLSDRGEPVLPYLSRSGAGGVEPVEQRAERGRVKIRCWNARSAADPVKRLRRSMSSGVSSVFCWRLPRIFFLLLDKPQRCDDARAGTFHVVV